MTTANHHLKCLADFYQAVIDGTKPFEVRKNDRNFQTNDTVQLMEITSTDDDSDTPGIDYTGREAAFTITYILQGERWGIKEGYCVLGLKKLKS